MTNEPVRDDAELMRVFDFARNHPDNWDQRRYFFNTNNDDGVRWDREPEGMDCGTTYCMAGFKAFVFDNKSAREVSSFFDYGRDAFGLTEDEAYALFYCTDNTRVEGVLKDIMNDEYREGGSKYSEV